MKIAKFFCMMKKKIKNKWQYFTKGYSDEDLEDIEHWLYGKLYILLKEFSKQTYAVPPEFDEESEWGNTLLMISSLCKEIYDFDEKESPYIDKFKVDYDEEDDAVKFTVSNVDAYNKHKEWVEKRSAELQSYKEVVLNFLREYGDALFIVKL